MMEVLIRNAEGNLSQFDRDYAAKKLGKLDRYFNKATKVEFVHREVHRGNRDAHKVEVTIFADGLVVRGEEEDASIHAAIDIVGDKLENRLRRIKKRLVNKYRHSGDSIPKGFEEETPEDDQVGSVQVKERKQFPVKPQTIEDAALEMDLLGYPFFIFKNEHTNRVEVLYRRKDGAYGLLEPEA